jgi:sulfatase modifying factor 1
MQSPKKVSRIPWIPRVPLLAAGLATGLAMLASGPDAAEPDGTGAGPPTAASPSPPRAAGTRFADALSDGSSAPEMVVIPAGRVIVGSPGTETGRQANEGPQREITIGAFALARTEVSRAQFDAFVRATGHKTDAEYGIAPPGRSGWSGCNTVAEDEFKLEFRPGTSWRQPNVAQAPNHPVVCVSWNDANAYAAWLSRETGQSYRLPSEAEFEYAARAGSAQPWPWGSDPDASCASSNGADASGKMAMRERYGMLIVLMFEVNDCDDGHGFTAPVGSLRGNAFGVHDLIGNVYEWTADCYAASHSDAPDDGSARAADGCVGHPIRGGAWSDQAAWLRSAVRIGLHAVHRNHNTGFRVARDLAAR